MSETKKVLNPRWAPYWKWMFVIRPVVLYDTIRLILLQRWNTLGMMRADYARLKREPKYLDEESIKAAE